MIQTIWKLQLLDLARGEETEAPKESNVMPSITLSKAFVFYCIMGVMQKCILGNPALVKNNRLLVT